MRLERSKKLAQLLSAREQCLCRNNEQGLSLAENSLEQVLRDLPSGSGLDAGPRLDFSRSTSEKMVFIGCDFHHMDDAGGYDGWSHHEVIVRGSLAWGISVRVTGKDRAGIKEYLGEIFERWLGEEIDW